MRSMPSAEESRRLEESEMEKAEKLPVGDKRESNLKKARGHKSSADSEDWRNSNLHKPT